MPIEWLTAFLDFPPATVGPASAYWQAVTGYRLSAPRGPAGQPYCVTSRDPDTGRRG